MVQIGVSVFKSSIQECVMWYIAWLRTGELTAKASPSCEFVKQQFVVHTTARQPYSALLVSTDILRSYNTIAESVQKWS